MSVTLSAEEKKKRDDEVRAALSARYDREWGYMLLAGQRALDINDPLKKEDRPWLELNPGGTRTPGSA